MNLKMTTDPTKGGAWAGLFFCTVLVASAQNPVLFQVDMSVKTAEGTFIPGVDSVEARGSFDGWGGGITLTSDPGNTNIYAGSYDVTDPPGSTVFYKFKFGSNWEDDPNRSFVLPAGGTNVPPVFFNRDSVISTNVSAAVYFQVDMNVQITTSNFLAGHEVWARGNLLGWGDPPGGLQLFEDISRSGVYTNTYSTSLLTGDNFFYKYTIWKPGVTYEDGDNKVLVWDGSEPTNAAGARLKTVGPTYFNGVGPADILSADTLVTFRVNMTNAQRFVGATPFDPANEGVYVNGSFIPWWSWNSPPDQYASHDDGSNGDVTAGDKIYSFTNLFLKGSSTKLEYKYGIYNTNELNNADNEAAFGANHIRFIRSLTNYVLPVDTFGVMLQEPVVGSLLISPVSGGNVTLTWNGRPGVRLQSAANLKGGTNWVDHPGSDGISSTNLPVGNTQSFFRLAKP